MAIDMIYDSDEDTIVFASVVYEDDLAATTRISIPRAEVLQRLMELSAVHGAQFTVFDGVDEDNDVEATEMTFLSPPTDDCILDDEEAEE